MNYVFTGLLSFAFLLSAGAGGYRQYTYRFGDHFPPTTFEGNVVHLLDGEKARNQISKGEPMTTPSGERIPAAAARISGPMPPGWLRTPSRRSAASPAAPSTRLPHGQRNG